ncbi:MAG: MATE family efflux transporter [archaeon]
MTSPIKRKHLPKSLTEGSIVKALITLAVPIVLGNILQTAYQLTDTFWVGRLGVEAVAAVSLSFPIIFLLISLGGGFAIAGTILVAQYKGKKEQYNVDHIAAQTMIMVLILSTALSTVGYFLSEPIIKFMGADPAVLAGAVSYLRISFIGVIFLFGYFVFQSLMRGVGDVKTPMIIVLGTVLLNLILDPLFIFGFGPIPAFGVSGAAMATIGTQGIAAILGIIMLFSGKYGVHLKTKHLKPDFAIIRKMFKLGFPASIEQSTRALNFTIMTLLVASFGTLAVASYGIGFRILSFVIIPAMGLSMANSTLVGHNMGAGKIERAVKTSQVSSLLAFMTLTVVGILLFVFAAPIAGTFIPSDMEVIQMSSVFIRIMALTFGFIGVQQVLTGTLQGSGNTVLSMTLSIATSWVINFPLAYILSKHSSLGIDGLWWSFPISNVFGATILYVAYRNGSWKSKKITEEFKISKEVMKEAIIDERK